MDPPDPKSLEPDLYVSIDFGTTYTGVAWLDPSLRGRPIQVVTDWPGAGSIEAGNETKVPSVIARHTDERTNSRKWGFRCEDIKDESAKWRYLKVFLEPNILQDAVKKNLWWVPSGLSEVHELVSEYLSHIYSHIRSSIPKRMGGLGPEKWDKMAIEFLFSVPTTWKEQELLNSFESIIRKAGFGQFRNHGVNLRLTEAEAAAVACINHVGSAIRLVKGDTFLSIDAGGGTTDLALVKVISANPPILEQVQDVQGNGIGSRMIDLSFQKLVIDRIAAASGTYTSDDVPENLASQVAQSLYYRDKKHRFGNDDFDLDETEYKIEINGVNRRFVSEELGIKECNLIVSRQEFTRLFDMQVDQILGLLDEAVGKFERGNPRSVVKYIILSGGLGSSEYLLNRLRRHVKDSSSRPSLKGAGVQISAEPQLVVIKGLLLHQRDQVLQTRIAGASYGVVREERYNKKLHSSPRTVIDPCDGHEYARGRIHWFVKAGQKIKHDCSDPNALPPAEIERRVLIPSSPDKQPPGFSWEEEFVFRDNPDDIVVTDRTELGEIPTLFTIRADLSGIDPSLFPTKRRRYWVGSPGSQSRWQPWKKIKTVNYYVCQYKIHLAVGPCGDLRTRVTWNDQTLPGSEAPCRAVIESKHDTGPTPPLRSKVNNKVGPRTTASPPYQPQPSGSSPRVNR